MFKSLMSSFGRMTMPSHQNPIWKQLTPSFIMNKPHPYSLCSSSQRPVLYLLMDDAVYQISLSTGYRPGKIRQYENLRDPAIACDADENIIIQHGQYPNYEYIRIHPESPMENRWKEERFTDYNKIPNTVRDHFVRYSNACRYSCVDDDQIYHYYSDREDWRLYEHIGDIPPPLGYPHNRPTWVCPDGQEVVFGFQAKEYTQVYRTSGDKYHLVWRRQAGQDPLYVIYSPVERTLYGLVHEKDNMYHISTYMAVQP